MEMVELGRTGVTVSRLGFGGAPVGLTNYIDSYNPADKEPRAQVLAAIQRAVELGITYFDTAPAYGKGLGETIYGEALLGLNEAVFVATKVLPDEENVRASVEASLSRLRRDKIDLLQIHGNRFDNETTSRMLRTGGLVDQMTALKEEGLVRFLGFTSEDNNAAIYRLMETDRFDTMQICYNLLFQHPVDWTHPFGSMVEAEARGMGIITMRALTAGIFQKWMQHVHPENTFDYTPALLQFVLSNPLIDVALVGMRTVEMVEQNVRICDDTEGRIDLAALHEKFVEE